MKKQTVQFGVVITVLVLCIGGYFLADKYFDGKSDEETTDTITAFEIKDNTKITKLSYIYSGGTISLTKEDEEWLINDDKDKDLDEDVINNDLLSTLSKISAESKIDAPEDLEQYGFSKDEDGKILSETTSIQATDAEGNEYGIYIGCSNPYDSSKYYMMIEGDDNVYVVDSTISDIFSKSVDDLEKEEETTTVEETTETETTAKE